MAGSPIALRGQAEATAIPPPVSPGCVWRKKWNGENTSAPSVSAPIGIDLPVGGVSGRRHAAVTIRRLWGGPDTESTKYGQKQHMTPECRGFSLVEMRWNALWEDAFPVFHLGEREAEIVHERPVRGRGRKRKCSQSLPKKESKSDLVCGFGGGPVEIIFILKVEVSKLTDHNKHGQPGFQLWWRWLQGVWTVGGGLGRFPSLSLCFSSSPPTPAAVDVGHHGEFVQSHSVGGED